MGNRKGISLNKGQLIELIAFLKRKYRSIKISDLQDKINKDKSFEKLTIYLALFGGKKVKILTKEEGIIQRIKKEGHKLN